MTPSPTIDTNIIMEYWKEGNKVSVVVSLLNVAESGRVQLAITTRIEANVPLPPPAEKINDLSAIGVIRIGNCRLY